MSKITKRSTMGLAIALLLMAITGLTISALAQQSNTLGGYQLDANLGVNTGGYNRSSRGASYMNSSRYTVGSSRPLYTTDRDGQMRYNPHNAFSPRSKYSPTGYAGGSGMTSARHSRFRYGSSGSYYGR